jgi:competence protein ComEA
VSRTGWLAVLGLVVAVLGLMLRLQWPSSRPSVECSAEEVRWVDAGTDAVALCQPGRSEQRSPAGPLLTLGGKLNLNDANPEELAQIPGIGRSLAKALVKARNERKGFRTWEEVDAVSGVGPAKLAALKGSAELGR